MRNRNIGWYEVMSALSSARSNSGVVLEDADVCDATLDDLPRIVAIYNAAIPGRLATADTEPVTVEQRTGWLHAHKPRTRPLWILRVSGQIVGWLSLSDFYGRPAYAKPARSAFMSRLNIKAQDTVHYFSAV